MKETGWDNWLKITFSKPYLSFLNASVVHLSTLCWGLELMIMGGRGQSEADETPRGEQLHSSLCG